MDARTPAPPLPDAAARREAATCFDRNLVVTAGAGTGKTALLVERTLNLIGSGTVGGGSIRVAENPRWGKHAVRPRC